MSVNGVRVSGSPIRQISTGNRSVMRPCFHTFTLSHVTCNISLVMDGDVARSTSLAQMRTIKSARYKAEGPRSTVIGASRYE